MSKARAMRWIASEVVLLMRVRAIVSSGSKSWLRYWAAMVLIKGVQGTYILIGRNGVSVWCGGGRRWETCAHWPPRANTAQRITTAGAVNPLPGLLGWRGSITGELQWEVV